MTDRIPFDRHRRGFARALAAGAALLPLGLAGPMSAWAAGPARGPEVLRIVGPWEIVGLDPSRAGYLFSRMEIVETLFEADDDGAPRPGLVRAWTVSEDGRRWTLQLRPGARFHDDTAVTADAVVLALNHALAKPGVLGLAPVERVAAEDGAVVVHLREPFAPLAAVLAHSSTQILAPASYAADGTVSRIIGSGPYRITALQPPQRFEVERVAGWDGTPPAIARVSYLAVGRSETRALMAESGEADLVFGLDPASFQRLGRSRSVSVASVLIPRTIYLKLNAGHPWLSDPQAREAISLALSRNGIARAVLRDPELAAGQLLPPTLAAWHDPALGSLEADVSRARALLGELGWQAGADGMLQRPAEEGGAPFALRLLTFPDRPELPTVAAAIQDQLRQIGIAVAVSVGNSSEVPAGHRDGTLEMALGARNYALVPDPLVTLLQDFGPEGGDWGAMGWSHPEFTDTLNALARVSGAGDDERGAATLRRRLTSILQRELPLIPVAWYRLSVAVSPRLSAVSVDPLERSYRVGQMGWAAP